MATSSKDLSYYDASKIPSGKGMRIAVLVSEWNENITFGLRDGAVEALLDCEVDPKDIIVKLVPGSFELPLAAQYYLQQDDIDGVICLGSVVQGETKHFDFVCQGTTEGLMNMSLKYNKPAIFGVLTDNTMQQGIDRSGGKHGNKGIECAIACIKMIHLKNNLN